MGSLNHMCAAALLFLPVLAGAQQATTPATGAAAALPVAAQSTGPAGAGGRRIRLNMVVTDQKGTPISGLTQQDFTVLDEKQSRPIVSFSASGPASQPVQAILVIDTVNLDFEQVSVARQQIAKFLVEDGGHLALPVSILLLTDKGVSVVTKPTTDGNRAAAAVNGMEAGLRNIRGSEGFYGSRDRYNLSLRALSSVIVSESGVPGRKLLIWMGAGWPLLQATLLKNQSKEEEQKLFDNIVLFNSLLRAGQITLYSVSSGESHFASAQLYRAYLKGARSSEQADTGDLGTQVLAIQSGGLALGPNGDLAGQIAQCIRDTSAYYTLSFDVPPTHREDEYHDLKVQVDKPALTVRTSTVYYNQP